MPRSLYRSLLSSHLKKRFAAVAFRLACTMLIDSAPEIMLLAVDPKEHFVQTYSGEPRPLHALGCALRGWRHGEGIHHMAFDRNDIPFEQRMTEFARCGFQLVRSESWMAKIISPSSKPKWR